MTLTEWLALPDYKTSQTKVGETYRFGDLLPWPFPYGAWVMNIKCDVEIPEGLDNYPCHVGIILSVPKLVTIDGA